MTSFPSLRGRIVVLALGILLAIVGAACLSFTTVTLPDKIWSQLGISEATGSENIRKSFIEGYLYTYGASAAKKVALGERAAMASDVMAYARSYTASTEFQDAYRQVREQQKPVPPTPSKTKEEIRAEHIASIEKSKADTEKSLQAMSPEMRESMKDVVKMFDEQLADFKNPDSEMVNYLAEAEKFNHESSTRNYEASLVAWQKAYPENYHLMIRHRLEQFLEVTEDVDYNAAVHEQYGLKKFNNAAYEKKPREWKMAYRAGKPAVDAAREFATMWLKELR